MRLADFDTRQKKEPNKSRTVGSMNPGTCQVLLSSVLVYREVRATWSAWYDSYTNETASLLSGNPSLLQKKGLEVFREEDGNRGFKTKRPSQEKLADTVARPASSQKAKVPIKFSLKEEGRRTAADARNYGDESGKQAGSGSPRSTSDSEEFDIYGTFEERYGLPSGSANTRGRPILTRKMSLQE